MPAILPAHHRRVTTNTTAESAGANLPEPYRVAPDTWVVPEIVRATPDAVVAVNSMVIAGAEPVGGDTGNEL